LKQRRIHIFGASGSGTTTLGRALAQKLSVLFFDTDDYFWLPTDPPYQQKRPIELRLEMLSGDLSAPSWVLSGSLVSWADSIQPLFTLCIFITIDKDLRLARLLLREQQRYGSRLEPGQDMHQSHLQFMEWAAQYDTDRLDVRSRAIHKIWLESLSCATMHLDGATQTIEQVDAIIRTMKEA
jgi:adenylate kinase family enzyme